MKCIEDFEVKKAKVETALQDVVSNINSIIPVEYKRGTLNITMTE